jgi:hypothetical protein
MEQHRHNRHNKLRDAFNGSFLHWGIITAKEPGIREGSLERADIEIAQSQGPVVLEVSVTSFLSVNTKHQQRRSPLAVTTIREKKDQQVRNFCADCTQ